MLRLRRTAHRPTGGERAAPPVLGRYAPSPDRPPLGTVSPTASGIGSPFWFFKRGRLFLKRAFAQGPAGAKNSEEWRAICLQIVRRYRNRPEGGMPATEYYARTCEVESDLCQARRRRGKRARLFWSRRCHGHLGLPYGRVNRFSDDWGYRTIPNIRCVRCRANLGP